MDKLRSVLRRDFPDYQAVKAFEAGIPVYFIQLEVEVLEKPRLNIFHSYFLRLLALEVTTPREISRLLGVDEQDLASTAATLLMLEYMEQGPPNSERERPLILTSKGRKALAQAGPPPVPKSEVVQFHFNALTWRSIPQEENTWSAGRMLAEGLPILPMNERDTPTLGLFTEQGVTQTLSSTGSFQERKITDLLQLKKASLEYIAPVTGVLLERQNGTEQRLVLYRNYIHQQADSVALQRFFEKKQFSIPGDAVSLEDTTVKLCITLPSEVSKVVQDLAQNEDILTALPAQLAAPSGQKNHERRGKVQHPQNELRAHREVNRNLRERLHNQHIEFLRTSEHRPLLEHALRESQEEVIIISPSMNRVACDDTLVRLIGGALKRGVRVRIGYDAGKEGEKTAAARQRNNIRMVRRAFQSFIDSAANLFEMKEVNAPDIRILVYDRTFAINGNFSWLSNPGQQQEDYRNEVGLLFRSKDQVLELANIALTKLANSKSS